MPPAAAAIDRYRREKQAPLLKRTGQLFSILIGQSFTELQLKLDQHDNAHLAGIRRSGGNVPVSGMSTGTADQLYLALRLAAVEDYLGHARPLPFDDLFINFDDDRSRAGFEVLGEIAKRTQVLFFTHHRPPLASLGIRRPSSTPLSAGFAAENAAILRRRSWNGNPQSDWLGWDDSNRRIPEIPATRLRFPSSSENDPQPLK